MASGTTTGGGAPSRTWRTGVALGLLGWALGVALGQIGVAREVDALLYDASMRSSEELPPDDRVARVYVGDRDITAFAAELGRWPWRSRIAHALALDVLNDNGVTAVGYDVFFIDPALDDSDEELMFAVASGTVVHGCLFQTQEGDRWGEESLTDLARETLKEAGRHFGAGPAADVPEGRSPAMPIDPLLEASSLIGHCNPLDDADRSVRRVPLFLRYDGRLYPSLSLRLALIGMGADLDDVIFDPDGRELRIVLTDGEIRRVPVDPDGALWVHYDRSLAAVDGFQYTDLDLPEVHDRLEGRLVVLGASTTASTDLWRTPMAEAYPGFLIHAQVVENLMTGRHVAAVQPDRYPFGRIERYLHLLLLAACAALGVGASRIDARWAWALTFVGAATPLLSGWYLLTQHDVWITPTTGMISVGAAGFLGVGYHQVLEARERRRVRRVYERYLSPEVLRSVLADPTLLRLGGARKELTVFFSDIRGFTAFSETVEPEELTERLNEYYGEMIAVAHRFEATVDKLIGDSLMVFFGDPVPQPDHASRAVRMALAMQQRLGELRAAWATRGVHPFDVGMGIATGFVAVGNLGSEGFVDYTVIGRSVNVAARLEGAAGAGEILVDDHTYAAVREEVEADSIGPREFKGIARTVTVYRVTGLAGS